MSLAEQVPDVDNATRILFDYDEERSPAEPMPTKKTTRKRKNHVTNNILHAIAEIAESETDKNN
jgi:hypothetical protein